MRKACEMEKVYGSDVVLETMVLVMTHLKDRKKVQIESLVVLVLRVRAGEKLHLHHLIMAQNRTDRNLAKKKVKTSLKEH